MKDRDKQGHAVMLGLTERGVVDSMDFDPSSQSLAVIVGSQVVVAQANDKFSKLHPRAARIKKPHSRCAFISSLGADSTPQSSSKPGLYPSES